MSAVTNEPEIAETETTLRGLTHRCIDPDCHVPDFVMSLEDQDAVTLILSHIENLVKRVEDLDSHIAPIIEEVKPAMTKLTNSPMFRMMTAGSGEE